MWRQDSLMCNILAVDSHHGLISSLCFPFCENPAPRKLSPRTVYCSICAAVCVCCVSQPVPKKVRR